MERDFRYMIIERSRMVDFKESTHEYTKGTETATMSVTGFVSSVFPVFDAKKMSQQCTKSRKYAGKSAEDIELEWETNGKEAARLGTMMHQAIEIGINTGYWDEEFPEMEAAKTVYGSIIVEKNVTQYFCEAMIYNNSPFLPGTVDILYKHPTRDEFYIGDWKRTDKVEKRGYGKGCIGPFVDIEDNSLNRYSLQLHIYRYILIKCYGFNVPSSNLFIVAFSPGTCAYKIINAVDMYDNVVWMFDNFNVCLENFKKNKNIN